MVVTGESAYQATRRWRFRQWGQSSDAAEAVARSDARVRRASVTTPTMPISRVSDRSDRFLSLRCLMRAARGSGAVAIMPSAALRSALLPRLEGLNPAGRMSRRHRGQRAMLETTKGATVDAPTISPNRCFTS
jgi:hypothetical protein